MSHGSLQEDTGLENPLAVHIRNFPVSLITENKFKECISEWRGVDLLSSSCHHNPNNSTWNGWAIVYFQSEDARNSFINCENQHYVRDTFGELHKLKVKKWIEKVSSIGHHSNNSTSSNKSVNPSNLSPSPPTPLNQKPFEIYREPTLKEFEKKISECSNKCFKGYIKCYLSDNGRPKLNKLGYSGLLAVTVLHQGKLCQELVLFHSACVWVCTEHGHCRGTLHCGRQCSPADYLPAKLKPEDEVFLTARKIPSGIQCSVRYQAKCVWQGEASLPHFVKQPVRLRLDEYLDEYIDVTDTASVDNFNNISSDHEATTETLKEKKSSTVSRQKPLTGGLKQLNSDQANKHVARIEKKQTPTNFAEAVTAANNSQLLSSDAAAGAPAESVDIVEKAVIENFLSKDRVVANVGCYGRFHLDPSHFEDTERDLQSFLDTGSNLLVALRLEKDGDKFSKYVVIRAFADNQAGQLANKASQSYSNDNNVIGPQRLGMVSGVGSATRRRERTESTLDIDLDELDRYYDAQNEISNYLRKQIPILLPDLKPSSNFVESLINSIITVQNDELSTETDLDLLKKFFNHQKFNVNANQRAVFIQDYIAFTKSISTVNTADKSGWSSNDIQPLANGTKQYYGHAQHPLTTVDDLNLDSVEEEYMEHSQAEMQSQSSIIRVIILARKAGLEFNTFVKLYQEHCQQSALNSRSKIFSSKLRSYLANNIDQSMLDDTNSFLRSSGIVEGNRLSSNKLETYLPIMTKSINAFLLHRAVPCVNKTDISTTDSVSSSTSSSPMRSISSNKSLPSTSEPGSSRNSFERTEHSPKYESKYDGCDEDSSEFGKLNEYLISIKAADSQVIKTLKEKNVGLAEIFEKFGQCLKLGEGAKMKWNLEISKLQLNPVLGVTVFRIAEILWNFFSVHPLVTTHSLTLPENYLAVYDSVDYTKLKQTSTWGQLEDELYDGVEIMCEGSNLFKTSQDFEVFAGILGKIWRTCGLTSSDLENHIQQYTSDEMTFTNHLKPLRSVLGEWASMIKNIQLLSDTRLNVFNIVKATMTSYHPSVYEGFRDQDKYIVALFKNITNLTDNPGRGELLATEGVIIGTIDHKFVVVQTQFCKVLVHPAVFIKDNQFNVNYFDTKFLPVNGMLTVHSSPVYDDTRNFLYQLATLAWISSTDSDHADLPYPGALLPFDKSFYTSLVEISKAVVAKAEIDYDLSCCDLETQRKVYSKAWFDNRRSSNLEFDELNECVLISALVVEQQCCLDAKLFDLTILKYYNKECVTRYLSSQEFLHIYLPYFSSFELFKETVKFLNVLFNGKEEKDGEQIFLEMKNYLVRCNSFFKNEILEYFLKNLAERNELNCTKEDKNVDAAIDEPAEHRFKDPEPSSLERKIESIFEMVEENKSVVMDMKKRLDYLDEVVLDLAKRGIDVTTPGANLNTDRLYVKVWRQLDTEVEEIPTNKDFLLPLATVRSIFGEVEGLKYRVTSESSCHLTWRNLVLENGLIYPPDDGWGNRVYLARGAVNAMQMVGYVGSASTSSAPSNSNTINYLPNQLIRRQTPGIASRMSNASSASSVHLVPGQHLSLPRQPTDQTEEHIVQQQDKQLTQHASAPPPMPPTSRRNGSPIGGSGELSHGGSGQLSQLMMKQTSSSIWGSSPAPILGGISPVSLDFQNSANYVHLPDQL